MPSRSALVLASGAALLAAAAIGAFTARSTGAPSAFELAERLAATWRARLEAHCDALYGSGAIRAAVAVEIDAEERTHTRVEIDPSTAVAVERAASSSPAGASPGTRYEASRVRERVHATEPRLRRCRVALIADEALALPEGALHRTPTEAERSALVAELTTLVRGTVPLGEVGDAGASSASSIDVVLRPATATHAPAAGASALPLTIAWGPFAAGLALLGVIGAFELRRRRRRREAARAAAAMPRGADVLRAWAARAPRRVARILARWASRAAHDSRRPHRGSPQAAAIAMAELGPGLSAAVFACLDPEHAQRIALEIDARPATFTAREIDALCAALAADLEAHESERDTEAPAFLDLGRGGLPPETCAAIERELAHSARRRADLAAIEQLAPRELERCLSACTEDEDADEAASITAQLAPTVVARWLETLEPPARNAWIERIARIELAPHSCSEGISRSAAEARRLLAERSSALGAEMPAARIVARLSSELRAEALAHLEATDAAAADRVRENLLGFDDLARLTPESLRALLACSELAELALALHEAPQEIEAAVEEALTPRVRKRLSEERAQCASATKERVETARARLVEALRALFESGQIELPSAAANEAAP